MRVATAAKETLGERNKVVTNRYFVRGVQQNRTSKPVLNPRGGGACEYESSSRAAIAKERVIAGVFDQHPAEVGFRAKIAGGHSSFDSGVIPTRALQIVVAAVAYVKEVGSAHPGWLREERNQVVGYLNTACLYAAVAETVREGR